MGFQYGADDGDRPGRVILLNGASSSGKSSLAVALQSLLAGPWFLVPVDAINGMRSAAQAGPADGIQMADILRRTRRGYHRVVAALASVGNDVIMDYPLTEPWRLADLLVVLRDFEVTLVEVRCDLEEMERRERARGDRPTGLARSQGSAYAQGSYDLAVDTTRTSPEDCALMITEFLAQRQAGPSAFDCLRAAVNGDGDSTSSEELALVPEAVHRPAP